MRAYSQTSGHQDAIRATLDLAGWTLAWTATVALARFGPSHLWDAQPVAGWLAVALNLAVGIGWMAAHARFLQRIDELQRKIMVDALVVTLGVGWVGGFAYVAAHTAGLVTFDAGIAHFTILLGVVYMIAILAGNLRYR